MIDKEILEFIDKHKTAVMKEDGKLDLASRLQLIQWQFWALAKASKKILEDYSDTNKQELNEALNLVGLGNHL